MESLDGALHTPTPVAALRCALAARYPHGRGIIARVACLDAEMTAWFARLLRPAPDSAAAEDLARGVSPYANAVHLLWTAWVFLTPLFTTNGYTGRWLLLTALTYPVFLLLFARVLLAPRRHAAYYAWAMVVMGLALLAWYPSSVSYFIFGCVMLRGWGQSGLRYLLQLLVCNALFVLVAWSIGYPWQSLIWVPLMALIIGICINVAAIGQEKEAELRLSQEEVRRLATTAERERIGRDLHDLLGHTLSLITLKLELAGKLHDRGDARARLEIGEAEAVAREALAQVRSAVTGIRSSDLAGELAAARLLLECQGVLLQYAPPPGLPPAVEQALALVLREAVTNIARHARARRAEIGFEQDGRMLHMSVRDDGQGHGVVEGNGLAGMRERLRALHGSLGISARRGEGTCVLASVPLPPSAPAPAPLPLAAENNA